ncbi:MAG: PhzF family phenazine biosynthesis protein [Candidatus Zixiibacteriota bacterium]|nr:MAG: PhzF family phenazine biosynthesis protein [candidate division Zixibacteria bacterium]
MPDNILYIVDVFTEKKYSGNQLAVIRDAAGFSDEDMQRIAKEMNYSETTFILSDKEINGGYDVRIFTPEDELPFAGHPTIGTAFIIQQEIVKKQAEKIVLNLKVGQIPVTILYKNGEPDFLQFKPVHPSFGKRLSPADIAVALGLSEGDIDGNFPIQVVSTGAGCIIAPLKSLAALKKARVNKEIFFEAVKDLDTKVILIFSPEAREKGNQLSVRFFADELGIVEDPATGSANGCLAGYLAKYSYFGKEKIDIRVDQGHEIGRPSQLFLKAEKKGATIDIYVGGRVIMTARGNLV